MERRTEDERRRLAYRAMTEGVRSAGLPVKAIRWAATNPTPSGSTNRTSASILLMGRPQVGFAKTSMNAGPSSVESATSRDWQAERVTEPDIAGRFAR
jgi:hypothetical protein